MKHQSTSNDAKNRRERRKKLQKKSKTSAAAAATVTSAAVTQDFYIPNPTPLTDTRVNLPGCSRYTTADISNSMAEISGTPLDLVIGNRHGGAASTSIAASTSSSYPLHSYYKSTTPELPNR